jgi:hypothetical protein
MSPSSRQRLWSPTWRYALVAGLASVPVTLALNRQDPSGTWNVTGVALAALVAGYLVKRRGLGGGQVGFRAGVVGAVPVLWSVADTVPFVLGLAQPEWFTALQLGLVILSVPLLVGFVAATGALAGMLGGWLAERNGHPRGQVGAS